MSFAGRWPKHKNYKPSPPTKCSGMPAKFRGMTLIELMIVIAIVGILAAISIPAYTRLITRSREGATRGNLGSIRSALSVYYGDNAGFYPGDDLASLAL